MVEYQLSTNRSQLITLHLHVFLIISVFIVACNVSGEKKEQFILTTANNNDKPMVHSTRHRREVFRGQDNYYQRGYDLNRLRYERYMQPRIKPYFMSGVDQYRNTLVYNQPRLFSNYENFDDQKPRYEGVDEGTKGGRKMIATQTRDYQNNSYKPELPITLYQSEMRRSKFRMSSKTNDRPQQEIYDDRPFITTQQRESDDDQQDYYPTKSLQPNYPPSGSSFPSNPGSLSPSPGFPQSYSPQSTPERFPQSRPGRPTQSFPPASARPQSFSSGALARPRPRPIPSPPIPFVPPFPYPYRNSTFPGFPGYIRRDYPGYFRVPYTGFRCDLQAYNGYYADTATGCQVFHVCQTDGRQDSFLCPNGTLFHQKVQTCDWWFYVDCPSSPSYYYLNARIGVYPALPSLPATLDRFPKVI